MCLIRSPIAFWPVALCAVLAGGCSEYKPATDTLTSGGGSLSEQPVGGADWSCLGRPPARQPDPGDPGAEIIYSLPLFDLATQQAFPDVSVRACSLLEPDCIPAFTDWIAADEGGVVNVPLTENFVGYLEIRSPSAVPYIFHLPDTGLRTMRDFALAMISLDTLAGLLMQLDLTADPSRGAIAVRAFDCRGNPAAGVALKSNKSGLAWYFENNLPSIERQFTDTGGLGGFMGAEPGLTAFEATLPDGTPIAAKSLIVRPEWMTAGYMRPSGAID